MSKESAFNGPMERARYHLLPQYIASPGFPGLGSWRTSSGHIYSITAADADPVEPVRLMIVGRISAEKVYLAPHGNFNPMYADPVKGARGAKLQFTLECPVGDPDFEPDFQVAALRMAEVEESISFTTKRMYFLQGTPGQAVKSMRFNFPLWETMTPANDNFITNYTVGSVYTDHWNEAKETHQLCALPVFDADDTVIASPEMFTQKLIGSLAEVTFTLRHYHMGITATRPEAQDSFAAKLESVSVLRPPPKLVKSPYKESIYTRKPRPMPQTPTRGEHKNAARAFVPNPPLPPPIFTQGSSTRPITESDLSIGSVSNTIAEVPKDNSKIAARVDSNTSPAEVVKTRARTREETTAGDDDTQRPPVAKKSKV